MTTYIVQASRGAKQLPTFFLDANVQGITSPAMAARIALDTIASGEQTYLRETLTGSLEAIVRGVTYHVHAAEAEDMAAPYTVSDEDALAAGRLLVLSESGDSMLDRLTLRAIASDTARLGATYGRGMLNGLWYTLGNAVTTRHPYGFHSTWVAGRRAFGEVV